MSDIVERLRKYGPHPKDSAFRIHDEAADEIERLRTALEMAVNDVNKYGNEIDELRTSNAGLLAAVQIAVENVLAEFTELMHFLDKTKGISEER